MTQESESPSVSVTAIDSEGRYSVLEDLLVEYHTWLVTEAQANAPEEAESEQSAGPAAPDEEEYDPAGAAAEDVATISDPETDRWGFIGTDEGTPAGVALLYGVSAEIAEIKRLYVRPEHRGKGLGRALCRATVEAASEQGYRTVGLTTPPWSEHAHAIYEALGFEYTDPYPETTLPERLHEEALFMQRSLGA